MTACGWLALLLLTVGLALSARAHAQSPSGPASADDARARFARGEAAYNQGDYRLAIQEWEAAYAADPRPRIQYNIYQARERLGELSAAAEALQHYLDAADRSDPFYENAQARMANLQTRLQSTGVRLTGGPARATVRIDDRDQGQLPLDMVALSVGQHRIVVTVEGHADFVSNVVVAAGQVVEVPVVLEASPAPEPEPTPAPPPIRSDVAPTETAPTAPTQPPLPREPSDAEREARPYLLVSAGLAAGTVIAGVWTLNRDAVLEGCDDPAFFCPRRDTVSQQRTIAAVTTGVLGAGAVGVFVYGLVVRLRAEPERDAALVCGPAGAGAWCKLRF